MICDLDEIDAFRNDPFVKYMDLAERSPVAINRSGALKRRGQEGRIARLR